VGRGIALLFHDRGTRRGWVVSSTPRPHFTPGKDPVSILQEAGWASGPVWKDGKTNKKWYQNLQQEYKNIKHRSAFWSSMNNDSLLFFFRRPVQTSDLRLAIWHNALRGYSLYFTEHAGTICHVRKWTSFVKYHFISLFLSCYFNSRVADKLQKLTGLWRIGYDTIAVLQNFSSCYS